MKTYIRIKHAMRENERDLLAHIRKYRVGGTPFFNKAWHNALDRLLQAGKVRYSRIKGCYVARKRARPVTKLS